MRESARSGEFQRAHHPWSGISPTVHADFAVRVNKKGHDGSQITQG